MKENFKIQATFNLRMFDARATARTHTLCLAPEEGRVGMGTGLRVLH